MSNNTPDREPILSIDDKAPTIAELSIIANQGCFHCGAKYKNPAMICFTYTRLEELEPETLIWWHIFDPKTNNNYCSPHD